jgi:hypothetical protein
MTVNPENLSPGKTAPVRNQKKEVTLWLSLILLAAAVLRFTNYGAFSYANDEMSALFRLHYPTFSELVAKGFYVDGHPGGVQVFLWKWVSWFGDTERAVRLPFVLLGILGVYMGYRTARQMFGDAAGLFAAAALSFLQFPLLYSQIARPYGPGMTFSLILIFFWTRIFFEANGERRIRKPEFRDLAGFTLSASLCMYTHYFSFLFALIVGLSGFIFIRRTHVLPYILSGLAAALLFVPHIPITLNHLTFKGLGDWLAVPGKFWILKHLFYIADESVYTLLLLIATTLSLLLLYRRRSGDTRFRILLAGWFLIPVLIGYLYSVKVSPVLQHPVLIFSFPCLILMVFSFAGSDFSRAKQGILGGFLVLGITGTVVINGYYRKQHFGEFAGVARTTGEWQQKYGDSLITEAISINNPQYIQYYLDRYGLKADFRLWAIDNAEGLKALSELVKSSSTPYFLFAETKPTPAEAGDLIRSAYPMVLESRDYQGFSTVTLYSRARGKSWAETRGLNLFKTFDAPLNLSAPAGDSSGPAPAQRLDSLSEYSPGITLPMDSLPGKGRVIEVSAQLFAPLGAGGGVLVASLETPDGKSLVWKGTEAAWVETPGKVFRLICTLRPDDTLPAGTLLKIYFWNKDKRVVYLSQLRGTVYLPSGK